MSGFFSRLKKRGADKNQPQTPSPTPAVDNVDKKSEETKDTRSKESSPALSTNEPPEPVSPQHAVEADSIFKGLNLSARVASTERSDSPYLQRSQYAKESEEEEESNNGATSFSFLHDTSVGGGSDSEKNGDEGASSFSFLNPAGAAPATPSSGEDKQSQVEDQSPVSSQSEISKDVSEVVPQVSLTPSVAVKEKEDIKSTSPFKSLGSRTSARQAPPTGTTKKKKKKAVRPGQQVQSEGDAPTNILPQAKEKEGSLISIAESVDSSTPSHHEEETDGRSGHEQGDAPTVSVQITSTDDDRNETTNLVILEPTNERSKPVEEVAMETKQPDTTVDVEHVKPKDKSKLDDKDSTSEPRSESITVETASKVDSRSESIAVDTVDESHELEEVFGNYRIELSGEDNLTALMESYQSSIKKIRDGGDSDEKGRSHAQIMEHELASIESLIKQRSEVQRLKSDEAKALAEEDYELAEKLNKELEKMSLTSEWRIVENGLQAIKDWMNQCAELSENEKDLRKSMQTELTSLKDEQSKALQEITKQLASLKNKEKMRVQALQDKIDRERGHIALDREHLERNEAKLKEELENRAAQPLAAKMELEGKLSDVETEISTLEAKLSQLRSERDKLKSDIEREEGTIALVREELSAEQAQLDKEKEVIATRDGELKKEEDKLEKERNLMTAQLMEEEGKKDSMAKVIQVAETKCAELASADETLEDLLSQLQPLVSNCQSKLKPSSDTEGLQEQCASLAQSVEQLSSQVLATQAKLTTLTKKVSDDEMQLQQITDAKQAAVTGRQFKEAGRLAAESKSLSAKLEEERSEVKSTRTQLEELNGNLTEMSDKLEGVRRQTNDEERKEDEQHIDLLGVWSKELREKSELVRGTALQEVLEKWCQLYQLLRESLSTKHGITLASEEEEGDAVTKEEPAIPTEERTPGVGSEEDGGRESTEPAKVEMEEEERAALTEKIASLEADLEVAIQEEHFNTADKLYHELETLKQRLDEKS